MSHFSVRATSTGMVGSFKFSSPARQQIGSSTSSERWTTTAQRLARITPLGQPYHWTAYAGCKQKDATHKKASGAAPSLVRKRAPLCGRSTWRILRLRGRAAMTFNVSATIAGLPRVFGSLPDMALTSLRVSGPGMLRTPNQSRGGSRRHGLCGLRGPPAATGIRTRQTTPRRGTAYGDAAPACVSR